MRDNRYSATMSDDKYVRPLAASILSELANLSDSATMSLPRLAKRLGLQVSVVMRELALMGDAVIGGVKGPGWARLVQLDDRWVAHLTQEGRCKARASIRSKDGPSSV